MIYKYYTDGAATMRKVNGEYVRGMGGYAWASVDTENDKILKWNSGQVSNTTNNEMELSAIHNALCHHGYPEGSNIVEIYSDSAYCVNIFTQWIRNWEANGWTRGKKHEPIENLDIIKSIWEMVKKLSEGFNEVRFIKVTGHSGDKYNEIVDKLAVEAKEGKKFIGTVSRCYLDEYIYPDDAFFFFIGIDEQEKKDDFSPSKEIVEEQLNNDVNQLAVEAKEGLIRGKRIKQMFLSDFYYAPINEDGTFGPFTHMEAVPEHEYEIELEFNSEGYK